MTIITALVLAAFIVLLKALGVFKRSFRSTLNDRLDADYVRCGLFMWKLLISAKGSSVAINQGQYLLPVAMAKAAKIKNGEIIIL